MRKVSKVMKELWEIKKEISAELYGKSWEEIDLYFKEVKKRFDEDMRNLREIKDKQKV
ncbi:MAG: hypothetical protein ABRQ39_21125 [Candidatus Eremiobacterota bacterium]